MSKKARMFVFALCLIVSNTLLGLVLTGTGQAQDILRQAAVDKSRQLFQLQIAKRLNRHSPTSASPRSLRKDTPDLVGNWEGEATKMTTDGVCSKDTVLVIIEEQCGNLVSGTIKVNTDNAIPIVGRIESEKWIFLSGYDTSFNYVSLYGKYKNKIVVSDFYYDPDYILNLVYDSFKLVEQ